MIVYKKYVLSAIIAGLSLSTSAAAQLNSGVQSMEASSSSIPGAAPIEHNIPDVEVIAAPTLTRQDISLFLQSRIAEQAGAADVQLLLDPSITSLVADNPTVDGVQLDATRRRFVALINTGNGITEVQGRYNVLVPVSVLINDVSPGDVISSADVEEINLPEKSLPSRIVQNSDDLIGMTAKRRLQPGKPVRTSDVRPPRLVVKGEPVLMKVEAPGINLTAEGRALEHGAKGDLVRILNTSSKQVVTGIVTAPQTVEVGP